ncbi:MAG: NAD(P)-binding domain-containing protein [Candidatus Competibacteraceae bacterium]|nr:NAD(P)-binding domain-containing protein [Candidatus Competibacteraceae bacterium]
MKIGILGTGNVGQALGSGFAQLGHEVKMGSRDPRQEKVKDWVTKVGANASAGTFAEAAAFSELAVLCTIWNGTENAIRLAGPNNLAGKIVIDTTNPLDFSGGIPPKLAVGHTDSAGEKIQRWLPDAKVVKAFNIVGSPHMFRPDFAGGPPDMFICGDDDGAKATVTEVLKAFGWSVVDIGDIDCARYLEPMAMVWIRHFFRINSVNHAFKLLRK